MTSKKNKVHNKRIAHQLNLMNATRIGLIKPKQYCWIFEVSNVWLKKFMLNWIFQIWILNHIQFKILTNFWRWNHVKRVHQSIMINFSNLMLLHRFCRARIAHCLNLIYHFFSILNFASLFFHYFLTPQTVQIQNFIIFHK